MSKVQRALISVSNKKGVVEFAKSLHLMSIEILSTGGTAKALRDCGIAVQDVSAYTGFPEMLDGRVKTLHPKIHGGLLSRRNNPHDMEAIKMHSIETIDIVVVNLYPFEETISKTGVSFADAIENIDIGGPAMLRSASKNFHDVVVIIDPADYGRIINEMKSNNGDVSYETRLELAQKVFRHTSRYDSLIADYLQKIIGEKRE